MKRTRSSDKVMKIKYLYSILDNYKKQIEALDKWFTENHKSSWNENEYRDKENENSHLCGMYLALLVAYVQYWQLKTLIPSDLKYLDEYFNLSKMIRNLLTNGLNKKAVSKKEVL